MRTPVFANLECGLHSGFPKCCVLWFSLGPLLCGMTWYSRLWGAVKAWRLDCGYMQCPLCARLGRSVRQRPTCMWFRHVWGVRGSEINSSTSAPCGCVVDGHWYKPGVLARVEREIKYMPCSRHDGPGPV